MTNSFSPLVIVTWPGNVMGITLWLSLGGIKVIVPGGNAALGYAREPLFGSCVWPMPTPRTGLTGLHFVDSNGIFWV